MLLGKDLSSYMKSRNLTYFDIVYNETDKIGMLIHITPSGIVNDCWGKKIPQKQVIWGYQIYTNGIPKRYRFDEVK